MIETQTGNKSTETHRAKLAYVSIRQSARVNSRNTLKARSRQSQQSQGGRWRLAGRPRRCRSSTRLAKSGAQADQRFGCQHL